MSKVNSADYPYSLSEFATKNDDEKATFRKHPITKDSFRSEFTRDYTRILHSTAFRRLRHKTQVFVHPQNDHVCTRLEHSLYVASISKTICKALGLNGELAEAIAIGHDLGHAPFGHEGERRLDEIAKDKDLLGFRHEPHSLRVVDFIESPYKGFSGLNLTFAVRDGIRCHCGEITHRKLSPNRSKTIEDLNRTPVSAHPEPATLEGCVVRFSDKIAYLGRDLEDAISLNIVEIKKIPKEIKEYLGVENRRIINVLITDIVKNSQGKDYVQYSSQAHKALKKLSEFSIEHIYESKINKKYYGQISKAMTMMFEHVDEIVADYQRKGALNKTKSNSLDTEGIHKVLETFLTKEIRDFEEIPSARLAIDFIAGMTDSYFIKSFVDLFLPQSSV